MILTINYLNWPHRFTQFTNSSRRIKYNLCSIQAKSHPIQRMMPPITNVDANFPKCCLENRVSSVSFHIICALIKVPNPRNMILPNQTRVWAYDRAERFWLHKLITPATTNLVTFLCLPIMLPWFPIIIAVFHIVSPCTISLSRMGLTMTILYFLARSCRNWVDSPLTGSANSHQLFSLVQNANGIVHASCITCMSSIVEL